MITLDRIKFDVIMNTNLDEKTNLILNLKNSSIEEFSNYISVISYNLLKKREKNKIDKLFEEFLSIKDDYEKLIFFDKIKRR